MRRPVMHRLAFQDLSLVVVGGSVHSQGINAACAPLGVEPNARDHHANRVDPVVYRMLRYDRASQAKSRKRLDPCLTRAKLAGLRVVR